MGARSGALRYSFVMACSSEQRAARKIELGKMMSELHFEPSAFHFGSTDSNSNLHSHRSSVTVKYRYVGTFTGWCWRRPEQSSGKTTMPLRPLGAGRRFAWAGKAAYYIRMGQAWREPPPVPTTEKAAQIKALVRCEGIPRIVARGCGAWYSMRVGCMKRGRNSKLA